MLLPNPVVLGKRYSLINIRVSYFSSKFQSKVARKITAEIGACCNSYAQRTKTKNETNTSLLNSGYKIKPCYFSLLTKQPIHNFNQTSLPVTTNYPHQQFSSPFFSWSPKQSYLSATSFCQQMAFFNSIFLNLWANPSKPR